MIYTIVIPLLLLFAPWAIVRFLFSTKQTSKLPYLKNAGFMWVSAGLWFVSQILPKVPIAGQTDTFIMHTIGGLVAALLYVYSVKSYQIKFEAWWQPWIGLFLFTSGLGVLNELFEFFLYSIGWPGVIGGDEWWDLTANTLGGFVAYCAFSLTVRFNKS